MVEYRRTHRYSGLGVRNEVRDSLMDLAQCLQRLAEGIVNGPYGLEKLAVAFDLRRIRLVDNLGSMMGNGDLRREAQLALLLAGRLAEELALPDPDPWSVTHAMNKLARALEILIMALDMKTLPTHRV